MNNSEIEELEQEKNFHFELKSSKKDICDFKTLIYNLLPNSISADIFIMALHEIIVNAAEHGNQMQANKKVIVDLKMNKKVFFATVKDQGRGFDWQEKIAKDFNMGENSDRGRGIMMTAKACDEFYYNKKGNKAYLVKKIDF